MYTYVLFNRNTPELLDKGVLSDLSYLLYILTSDYDRFSQGGHRAERTNIFMIPCIGYAEGNITTGIYSASVSRGTRDRILEVYSTHRKFSELKEDLLDGPGPYLVSSLKKLDKMTPNDPLVYIDLNRVDRKAYRKLLHVYKEYFDTRPDTVGEVCEFEKCVLNAFFTVPNLFAQLKEAVKTVQQ